VQWWSHPPLTLAQAQVWNWVTSTGPTILRCCHLACRTFCPCIRSLQPSHLGPNSANSLQTNNEVIPPKESQVNELEAEAIRVVVSCKMRSLCEHGRRRSRCKECGGSGLCEHGRERSRCKECGGSGMCEDGRRRSQCKDAEGVASVSTVDSAAGARSVEGAASVSTVDSAASARSVKGAASVSTVESAASARSVEGSIFIEQDRPRPRTPCPEHAFSCPIERQKDTYQVGQSVACIWRNGKSGASVYVECA
jgi:hypothetical protein